MFKFTIKKFLYSLIVFLSIISISYIFFSTQYIKDTTQENLHTESINKALSVSKKFVESLDKLYYSFQKEKEVAYEAMLVAQQYFQDKNEDSSLEELKITLNKKYSNLNIDVLIINKEYIITNSTYKPDLNLDFHDLPEALLVLQKVFNNPSYIDVSTPRYDSFMQTSKQYVAQKALNKNFIIQIAINLKNTQIVSNFLKQLKEKNPKLLTSKIFIIYPDITFKNRTMVFWDENLNIKNKKELKKINVKNLEYFLKLFQPENRTNDINLSNELQLFIQKNEPKSIYFSENGRYIHRVILPYFSPFNEDGFSKFIMILEFDQSDMKNIMQNVNYIIIFIWLILFLVVLITVLVVQKKLINPIVLLEKHVVEKKVLNNSVMNKNALEIASVMKNYNILLKDLKKEILTNEELLEQFKIFTGNAIHQIRTPISVIKIALEMIQSNNSEEMLQIKSSLLSIEHMYDSLSYTLQQEDIEFQKENLNLSLLLEERVAIFNTIARANDTELILEMDENIFVYLNKIEAEYLVDNNLSNAIKYGTKGKKIYIFLQNTSSNYILTFESYGKEIEDKTKIFARYLRDDNARRGSGIGLHMVKSICDKSNIIVQVNHVDNKNCFTYLIEKILH